VKIAGGSSEGFLTLTEAALTDSSGHMDGAAHRALLSSSVWVVQPGAEEPFSALAAAAAQRGQAAGVALCMPGWASPLCAGASSLTPPTPSCCGGCCSSHKGWLVWRAVRWKSPAHSIY